MAIIKVHLHLQPCRRYASDLRNFFQCSTDNQL